MANDLMNSVLSQNVLDPIDDFFGDFGKSLFNSVSSNQMKTDVVDNKDNYEVTSELPGIDKDDIHLTYHDNQLMVRVAHDMKKENKDEQGTIIRKEISSSDMQRAFYLPNVDSKKINANFENGILKIELPKLADQDNDHQINIK